MNPLIEQYLKRKGLNPEMDDVELSAEETDLPTKTITVGVPKEFFDPLGAPAAVPTVPASSRSPLKPSGPQYPQSTPSPIKSPAVRDYLMNKLNAEPRNGNGLAYAGALDTIGNAGSSISNIMLNRAGLAPNAKGTNFLGTAQSANAADVKGEGEQNDIAGKMYGQELAAEGRAAGDENADLERLRKEAADKQAAADKEKDRALKAKLQAEAEAARLALEKAKPPKTGRAAKAPKGAGGAGAGKTLPASTVSELSSLPVAEQQVDHAVDEFNRLNMGGTSGRISGAVTDALGLRGTDAAEYDAVAKLAMQAAGKILEGGKLAAGDEVKYRAMFPRPGDSAAVVEQKRAGMKAYLRELQSTHAKGLKDSGYNVPGTLMGGATAPATTAPAAGMVTFVDDEGEHQISAKSAAALVKAKKGKIK